MKTVKKIRDLHGWVGDAAVYECDPPLPGWPEWDSDDETPRAHHRYVIASTATAIQIYGGGCDTYLFPSDGTDVIDWGELPGSQKGVASHTEVFADLGYQIIDAEAR